MPRVGVKTVFMKKLKLNALCARELEEQKQAKVFGGNCCICGCNGTSSTESNGNANYDGSLASPEGGIWVKCTEDEIAPEP